MLTGKVAGDKLLFYTPGYAVMSIPNQLLWIDASLNPSIARATGITAYVSGTPLAYESDFIQVGQKLYAFYGYELHSIDLDSPESGSGNLIELNSNSAGFSNVPTISTTGRYGIVTSGYGENYWFDTLSAERIFHPLPGKTVGVHGSRVFFGDASWMDLAETTPVLHPNDGDIRTHTVVGKYVFFESGIANHTYHWLDMSSDNPKIETFDVPMRLRQTITGSFVEVGSKVYYWSYDEDRVRALNWIDISSGTPQHYDIDIQDDTGTNLSYGGDYDLRLSGNKIFFATASSAGVSLRWVDTTQAEPIVHEVVIDDEPIHSYIYPLKVIGNYLYFWAGGTDGLLHLYWIDTSQDVDAPHLVSTSTGTLATTISYTLEHYNATVGSKLFFTYGVSSGKTLAWIDTAVDPSVLNVTTYTPEEIDFDEDFFVVAGSRLYFQSTGWDGSELRWVDTTDKMLALHTVEVNVGPVGSSGTTHWPFGRDDSRALVGNRLYFAAYEGEFGYEMRWIDIRSTSPTIQTLDLEGGTEGSYPVFVGAVGQEAYFIASITGFGTELVSFNPSNTPSDIRLSQSFFAENTSQDNRHAVLSSTDADFGETFAYSLVAGEGDEDNDLFSIVDDKLVFNAPLDFETKSSYAIRIRTTDSTNRRLDKAFTISVGDVPEAPLTKPESYDVPANYMRETTDASGSLTSTAIDNGVLANDSDDAGDTFSAILLTPPLHGTLIFYVDGTFRYQPATDALAGQSETFRYRVTDSTGLSSEETVTLQIVGAIDSPFYNTTTPTDVSAGSSPGVTSSLDALAIINFLNNNRGRNSISVRELPQELPPAFYYDVNNDFVISALDILAVINFINARTRGGEGEGKRLVSDTSTAQANQADLYDAALVDLSELPNKKKT